jgi:hypothetical protein
VTKDQKIYILIGSGYDNVHKESPFQVEIVDLFDAGSTTDAGNEITDALEIASGDYPKNYLQEDDKDWFKIPVKAGENFEVKSLPGAMGHAVRLEVMDTNRVRLASESSPNAGALARIENVTTHEDGFLYVGVSSFDGGDAKEYSLSVKRKDKVQTPVQEESVRPTTKTKTSEPSQVPVTSIASEAHAQGGIINNVLFLKILLVLSVILNLVLTVLWLVAKFKKKETQTF